MFVDEGTEWVTGLLETRTGSCPMQDSGCFKCTLVESWLLACWSVCLLHSFPWHAIKNKSAELESGQSMRSFTGRCSSMTTYLSLFLIPDQDISYQRRTGMYKALKGITYCVGAVQGHEGRKHCALYASLTPTFPRPHLVHGRKKKIIRLEAFVTIQNQRGVGCGCYGELKNNSSHGSQ